MARKPDTPCADCGTLLWSGTGSRPAGERRCQDCRRKRPVTTSVVRSSDARTAGRKGRPWERLRRQVLSEETHCFRCGEPVDKSLPPRGRWSASVDHVVPLVEGGAPLDRSNVRLSHFGCNSAAAAEHRGSRDRAPAGLAPRGRRLWLAMHEELTFTPMQAVLLEEACRIADRLDRLDVFLRGEGDFWLQFASDEHVVTVVIDKAMSEARQQATALKQIVSELRQSTGATNKPARGGGVLDQLAARRAHRIANAAD